MHGSGGLVVNAGLTLNESLPLGLLSISASPQLLINTTAARLWMGVAPNTYEVELNNADVNFLGLQASGTLIVGVSDGVFEIDVPSSNPLQLSFFGLGGVSISGYIDSNGQFSLTGSLGFQLGQSGNEIWGSLQITISNNGFSGYFGGGCQIFGINHRVGQRLADDRQRLHRPRCIGFRLDLQLQLQHRHRPVAAAAERTEFAALL